MDATCARHAAPCASNARSRAGAMPGRRSRRVAWPRQAASLHLRGTRIAVDNRRMLDQPADLQVISGRLERGEIDSAQYLEQLMRFVAAQIGCTRAGLRLFVDTQEGRALRSVAMYDAAQDRMVGLADIVHQGTDPYLERLQHEGNVTAADAATDPVTAGALRDYVLANSIVSLMDMLQPRRPVVSPP